MKLAFKEVTSARWPDMEALFESRGAPSYCWCMAWRPEGPKAADKTERKAAMRKRVKDGEPVGILGYLDGEPVAWCSIAPRPSYRPLGGSGDADDDKVWSVACFFVKRDLRGQKLMPQLLQAAIRTARKHRAKTVEAYPVDPDSPSYRFMGFVEPYVAAGFRKLGRAGSRRHVMRLDLEER